MVSELSIPRLDTSSQTGTFYFAYGSNLSAVQMSIRLKHTSASSIPVAIARLDNHEWIICERGYANVVALPPSDVATDANTVWGVLYNMSAEDEAILDGYEGYNEARNPTPVLNPDPATQSIKRHLQGGWDYNKHFLPMTVTKWLRDPNEYGVRVPNWSPAAEHNTTIRALVYVDEFRTGKGQIGANYTGRMNRGIDESVSLGLPQSWVDNVLRKFIRKDIYPQDGYVGTDKGYVGTDD
ncbi:uncharacterized protein Z518_08441 [Rhinocladiella mackenziei CBS 650.93]|uniref:gamma-glutamylcyclotransferase n=1 Tax=Rhinocladiella mackenziei CBS 650.93 TaxID=1442369 RepID=A0A0D2J0W9_9EURO|nr:uncharacterized protein Z518_08441 [Rhinocladiella mackenziei CBS 650.93]KIX02500.1 hypothetical protein Z518_08441 [Rhinocladiella mackenziei CBS 650.93]